VAKKKLDFSTTDDEATKWAWESENPNYSGGAGDVAALFRAEGVETPGVLEIDAPAAEASLFSREAIQNSWDAAREWQSTCKKNGIKPHPFWIEFRFSEYKGFDKRKLVYALGLDEHASQLRAAKVAKGSSLNLGLASTEVLDNLTDGEKPLRVLTMTEHGGLGMPGSWRTGDSRMLSALLRVGYTQKSEGAGGSYGYGKAGLIAASAIRTIFTYSAFAEDRSDPGVTRRLIGVTYWKNHSIKQAKFTGWARLGEEIFSKDDFGQHRSAKPYENQQADAKANELGIAVRAPESPGGTGTTFMIIEPTIDASDLGTAIQRYWWPAMLDNSSGLLTKIIDFDGSETIPSVPKDDPHLQPFVRAFELASRFQDTKSREEARLELGAYSPHGKDDYSLGNLGLVANTQGWSFPDDDTIDHCTMVALIRGPRMVVNYHTFKNLGLPHIRGTFLADDSIDDLLRQTEDKAHTKWETKKLPGAHKDANLIATQVSNRLRKAVVEFKNQFKPPAPRPGDLNLPILDELSRLMKGNKPKPPKPEKRAVTIRLVQPASARPTKSGLLECNAVVEFGVADWVWDKIQTDTVEITAVLSVAFVEDDNLGERLTLQVKPSIKKFSQIGSSNGRYVYVGELHRDEKVEFTVKSTSYEPDWTVRFTPTASVTNPALPTKGNDQAGVD